MHDPVTARLLGDAGLALVEQVEGGLDGLADLAARRGIDAVALVPGGFDDRLQSACDMVRVLARGHCACQSWQRNGPPLAISIICHHCFTFVPSWPKHLGQLGGRGCGILMRVLVFLWLSRASWFLRRLRPSPRSWLLRPSRSWSCCPPPRRHCRPSATASASPASASAGRCGPQPGRSRQTQRQGAGHRLVLDRRCRRVVAFGHLHRQARDLARRLAQGHGLRRGGARPIRRGGAGRRRPHEARGGGDQARPRRLAGRHQRRVAPCQHRQASRPA